MRQALGLRVLSAEECVERECSRLGREDRAPGVRLGEPGVRALELPSRVRVTAKLGGKADIGWL